MWSLEDNFKNLSWFKNFYNEISIIGINKKKSEEGQTERLTI